MRNFVVFAGLAVVLAGCSGNQPAAPAVAASTASTTAAPSSSAAPVVQDVTRFLPTRDELDAAGLAVQREAITYVIGPTTPFHLVDACGGLPSDASTQRAAHGISYPRSGKGEFGQLVGEYPGQTGADVVASVKKATSCRKATFKGEQLPIVEDFAVPGLVDPQAGFCAAQRAHYLVRCVLVLGHGDRATAITFSGDWNDSLSSVRALAAKTAQVFVTAFDRG